MRKLFLCLAALVSFSAFCAVSESGPPRIVITPSGTGAGNTGELRFKELVANGNNHTGFKAPDSLAGNPIYTLPNADGTSGYVLSTNGSGVLSWVLNGAGSVSSVALSMPSEFSVSGSPVTTTGTFTVTKANQSANTVFAGPTSGGAAAPTFRALVEADHGANTVNTAAIKDANVTLAKIENISTDRLLGRDTAGSGVPEQLTVGGGVEFTGSGGIQRSAITGDVTASAGSNTTTIAASAVTGAKLESRVRPNYNYLINGDFAIDQRKQTALTATSDFYCLDRWNLLINGSFAGRMYQGTANPDTGSKYYGATTHSTAAYRAGIEQIIESKNMWHLRGKDVILQARVRTTEASKDVRACVISWTGSEDSVVSNIVNTWTSSTYTINNFFINNASLATISVSSPVAPGTTWTDISVSHTVNASATNLIIFIFVNQQTMSANEELQVSKAGLYEGTEMRTWMPRHIGEELELCQRYCVQWNSDSGAVRYIATGHSYTSTASQVLFHLPTTMRTTPVYAVSAVGDWFIYDAAATAACSAISVSHASGTDAGVSTVLVIVTNGALTTNRPVMMYAPAASGKYFRFESEL